MVKRKSKKGSEFKVSTNKETPKFHIQEDKTEFSVNKAENIKTRSNNKIESYYQSANVKNIGNTLNKTFVDDKITKRVAVKCNIFLLISNLLFAGIVLSSLFIVDLNPLILFGVSLAYIAFTTIFYIITPLRKFVYYHLIFIVFAFVALAIAMPFLFEKFSLIPIAAAIIACIIGLVAFKEVERSQLSSRLFFINEVSKSSVRVLEAFVIFSIVSVFLTSVMTMGAGNFVSKKIIGNDQIVNNIVLNNNATLSNAFSNLGMLTFDDFVAGYQNNEDELTYGNLISYYTQENGYKIDTESVESTRESLTEYAQERHGKLLFGLDRELTKEVFVEAVKAETKYNIDNFGENNNSINGDSTLDFIEQYSFVPNKFVVPAMLTLALLILLMVAKTAVNIIGWITISLLGLSFRSILWRLLKLTKVARIDIEEVESEVVSI